MTDKARKIEETLDTVYVNRHELNKLYLDK